MFWNRIMKMDNSELVKHILIMITGFVKITGLLI